MRGRANGMGGEQNRGTDQGKGEVGFHNMGEPIQKLSERAAGVTLENSQVDRIDFSSLNFSDKSGSPLILGIPALVAKWQTRTLEVRVG